MSRTNKDEPLHARATWWRADHWACQNDISRPWRTVPRRECDLPTEPSAASYDKTARYGPSRRWQCIWQPEATEQRDHWPPKSTPRWYVEHITHNPNRRREREYGREAIAEHRATCQVDRVLPGEQHRHSGQWYW